MLQQIIRPVVASMTLVVLGCVPALPQGPARAPNTEVPDAFGGALDTSNSALVDWHDFFEDPQLVALIDVALENNQELNIMVQEMLVTESEIMARRGEYLPRLGIGGGADVVRCTAVVTDQFNPGSRFAIHQYPHRQRLARANLERVDFRQDDHLQLLQFWQLGAFLINRQAVLVSV